MSTKIIQIVSLTLLVSLFSCNAKYMTHTADPSKKHERFVHRRQKEHLKRQTTRVIYHEHEEAPGETKFRLFDFY